MFFIRIDTNPFATSAGIASGIALTVPFTASIRRSVSWGKVGPLWERRSLRRRNFPRWEKVTLSS
jgi:hypothetical protein